MTKSITISDNFSQVRADNNPWQLHFILGIVANVAIWGSALFLLKMQPIYTSKLVANVPSSGSASHVNLPNIGQASYESSSPYANSIQDPRETFEVIAKSEPVLRAAAKQLNMSLSSFGQPWIKTQVNTTIIMFEFKGESPDEARDKTLAFYQAFQARLNQLRAQEATQRDVGFQSTLSASKTKLEIAQKRLSDYKARSGLNSNDQISALSNNIEYLRRQRAEILGQQQQASTRLREISASLKLSPQQAVDAFVLQTDQIFQLNLKDYSESSAALVVLSSKLLPNHPAILTGKAKQDATQRALLSRGQYLLGRPISQATLQPLNPSSTNASARETVFNELVTVRGYELGLQSQAQELNKQILKLEGKLKILAEKESTLEALNRDFRVAEAVFSTSLTKLDIGRSNAFGSYPLIQILVEPSLPLTPNFPKPYFVLLGAVSGSLFITTGFVLLWLRQRKIGSLEQEPKFTATEY